MWLRRQRCQRVSDRAGRVAGRLSVVLHTGYVDVSFDDRTAAFPDRIKVKNESILGMTNQVFVMLKRRFENKGKDRVSAP